MNNRNSNQLPDSSFRRQEKFSVSPASKGISFILCTYNGASRLPKTLKKIFSQEVSGDIAWEVIIIDNGSVDKTQETLKKCWPASVIPLKIIQEEHNIGIGRARLIGLREAKYEYMVFVDDDNWIEKNWVMKIFELMESHPEVGACGGFSQPAFEVTPPEWFERFKVHYAIGPEDQEPGYIRSERGWIWSAGMTIRKSAWNQILQAGFKLHLISRSVGNLLSGEDVEICYALQLAGWKLWFEPNLKFQHFIEENKLQWQYLRALHRGFGKSLIYFDLYRSFLNADNQSLVESYGFKWILFQIKKILKMILKNGFCINKEGSEQALRLEREIGKLSEMLYARDGYEKCFQDTVRYASDMRSYLAA